MTTSWYYVEGNDRIGPIDEDEFENLFKKGVLNKFSYVWKKGLENWLKAHEIEEIQKYLSTSEIIENNRDHIGGGNEEFPARIKKDIDWSKLSDKDKIFTIKIGQDRGDENGVEYGPYSLGILKKLYEENRINGKTLVFISGMENWAYLADLPIFKETFEEAPPVIGESERRKSVRRPFVARLFFHDNESVFEGVCRDVSIGGMQVLVSNFPGNQGMLISLNVHPDNSDYNFVATGKVVRFLDGDQGFSLRFVDLSREAKSAINSFINDI